MREAKYRAWHKLTSEMFEVHGISPTAVEERKNGISYAYDRKEVVLMQYTGLKDKNGVEIYEGDIVEAWSEGVKAIGQVQQRKDGLWIIYPAWQSEKFWGLCPNEEKETRVTILGNIFEHPELLKGE